LSAAGEVGRPGTPYAANGSDDTGLCGLHPHYQVMAVCMAMQRFYPQP